MMTSRPAVMTPSLNQVTTGGGEACQSGERKDGGDGINSIGLMDRIVCVSL